MLLFCIAPFMDKHDNVHNIENNESNGIWYQDNFSDANKSINVFVSNECKNKS